MEKGHNIKTHVNTANNSPSNFIYEKKIVCPVCNKNIGIKAVKSSGIRVLSRDSDFMIHYKEPNPLLYEAWFCIHCGYAATSNRFTSINSKQVSLVKEKISSKWKARESYPEVYNENISIEIHQLALLNSLYTMGKNSEKALICLKLSWLYRLKEDTLNENKYIEQSLNEHLKVYEVEDFPINGLDRPSLEYLIGEQYRRLEKNSDALFWFGKVISSRAAKEKIKEMARTQKDLIQGKQK